MLFRSFIAAAPTAAAGHRRIPRMGSGGVRWERACCSLCSRRVALLAICCRGASSGGRAWRHMPANCIPRRPAHSNVCSQCALGRSATARCPRNAFPSAWRWRYVDVMHSQAPGGGDMLTLCVPGCLTMAIFCPGVSQKGLGREKGPFVAIYRRRVFKMSWLWQDMRAMHPKSPANRCWRIHHVNILPGRGTFRCTGSSNHARRADLATIQRSQGLANGRQEELGIASALRIAADGPTTVVAYVCGSRARSR